MMDQRSELDKASIAAIIAAAWPDGAPAEQLALLASLPSQVRTVVLERLDAVCKAKSGHSPETLAIDLQIGRAGFFKMRSRWANEKSIAVLVPKAKRAGGRKKIAPPEAGADHPASLSHPTVRRIEREARRTQALESDALFEHFGRRFALDQTALDLPISTETGVEWAGAAFLLECQSGLILSVSVNQLRTSETMGSAAWSAGTSFAEAHKLRIPEEEGAPVLDVVLSELAGNPIIYFYYLQRLLRVVPPPRLHNRGSQRFGRFITELVGRDLGGIGIRPRTLGHAAAVPPDELRRRSAVSIPQAQTLVDVKVASHNAPIKRKLVDLGLLDGNGDGSALRRAFPLD